MEKSRGRVCYEGILGRLRPQSGSTTKNHLSPSRISMSVLRAPIKCPTGTSSAVNPSSNRENLDHVLHETVNPRISSFSEANKHERGTTKGRKLTLNIDIMGRYLNEWASQSSTLACFALLPFHPPTLMLTMAINGNSVSSSDYAVNVRCVQVIQVCHHPSSLLVE